MGGRIEKTGNESTGEGRVETVNSVKKCDYRKHFVVVSTCSRMRKAGNCRNYI